MAIRTYLLKITLNVNELNVCKKSRAVEWITNKKIRYILHYHSYVESKELTNECI